MAVRYRIVVAGRRAADPLLDAAEDYLGRLRRYARVELVRVKEGTAAAERVQIDRQLPPGATRVVLDERGERWTTERLAEAAGRWAREDRQVAFVIGGADGLDPALRSGADVVLSLSGFTLPHRLALVVLVEQLYRAHTVLAGEKYHRAG